MKRLCDLYPDLVKRYSKTGLLSDSEFIVLNRRDFLFSETSPTNTLLRELNSQGVTYEMHSLIDFTLAFGATINAKTTINAFVLSKSMTIAAASFLAFAGERASKIRGYAPRGLEKLQVKTEFSAEILRQVMKSFDGKLNMSGLGKRQCVDIIFSNASSEAEVTSSLEAFAKVQRGLLVIKGYGRVGSPNCGDTILSHNLHVHCNLSGFGFAAKI